MLDFEKYVSARSELNPRRSKTTAKSEHTATLLVDGTFDFPVGHAPTATAELYDPVNDTFTVTSSITAACSYHTATIEGTRPTRGSDLRAPISGASPARTAHSFLPPNGR